MRETAETPSSDILYIIIHMYIAFASAKLPTFEELLQESGEVLWGLSPGLNGLRRLQELTEHWREEPAVAELEIREGATDLRRERELLTTPESALCAESLRTENR